MINKGVDLLAYPIKLYGSHADVIRSVTSMTCLMALGNFMGNFKMQCWVAYKKFLRNMYNLKIHDGHLGNSSDGLNSRRPPVIIFN